MNFQNQASIANSIKAASKRKPFQADEDSKLLQLVELYGDNNWVKIASLMPDRTVRQCRERYQNNLRSNVKNNKWTKEEEELLKQKYYEFGPRWKYFEDFFPGRTSYNIRNRWNCIVRKWKNYLSINSTFISPQNFMNYANHSQINESSVEKNSLLNESVASGYDVDYFDFQNALEIDIPNEPEVFDELFENSSFA